MYAIYGTYRGETEEIDTAETKTKANYLVGEYQMAYGPEWTIIVRKVRNHVHRN